MSLSSSRPAPSAGADPFIGREVGPYRVEERLGEGGMGVVYRARDTRLGRAVALKVLAPHLVGDERARDRLLHEARAVAALDHPHVASVYDVGETEAGLFVAMAFYEGETLRQRLADGPLAAEEARSLARQIALGLGAAHRAGIVHRDVKPANVMVLPEGGPDGGPCAKVLDFGIAQAEDAALTRTGERVGTALYMAPEQLRGAPVDARADVWGLGVVLYEMLAGRRPFDGAYAAAVGYAVLHESPAPLGAAVPAPLAAVVERCLAKDPADRIESMAAVVGALDAHTAPPPEAPPRRIASGRRWGMGALAGVAALALAWFGLRPLADPPPSVAAPQRLVVLPFDASGPDAEALADGLVEVVTGKLGRLLPTEAAVAIVPASEVETGMSVTEARDRLGASLAVRGVVTAETDTVRVLVTLVDLADEMPTQRESREVGGEGGRTLALQDAVALEVAELLRVQVAEASRDELSAGGTEDPEANAYYLRGRGHLRNRQGVEDLARARALFEEALARDSLFVLARAALADAEWQTYERTDDVEWAERALASAERARQLDDRLPQVHTVFALIHEGLGEYEQALLDLDRALALDPADAEAVLQLAQVHSAMGHGREAEAAYRRAIDLDPDHWRPFNSFGVYYLNVGDAEAAARQFRLALERAPGKLSLRYNLGLAAWQQGDLETAQEAFARVHEEDPDHVGGTFGLLASRFLAGDFDGAVAMGEQAVDLLPSSYDARLALAEARWWADGERDQARQDYADAMRLARESLALGRPTQTLLTMAGAFAASGQRDSARVYLAELERDLRPADATVREAYAIGLAHELAGQRDEAMGWFESAFGRGFGRAQAARTPWLADLREESPAFRALLAP